MSLLERVEKLANVDVDDPSTEIIRSLPFVPHNQTSNQNAITGELVKPENEGLLDELVDKHGSHGWEKVYDMAAVHLCARNVPYLSGRTLVQTSLRYKDDSAAIIAQAHRYDAAFAELGVTRDRYALKLPFTGAGAIAAKALNEEGIRTLATTVFSLEQAIAASQSGCLFISPYYNEVAAHFDGSIRPKCKDYALEHPMSARVIHILEAYTKAYAETGKEQPIMVIASQFYIDEILALAELGCQHITILAPLLKALMDAPDTLPPVTTTKSAHPYAELATPERLRVLSTKDDLAPPGWDGVLATMETDYLQDGGRKLDEFIAGDQIVKRRMEDAATFFLKREDEARKVIEGKIARITGR